MSKFINEETIQYVKAKQSSTVDQQLQNIRERLNLEAEQQSVRCAKLEKAALNQSELMTHLGSNMLQMQGIVDEKYYELMDAIVQDGQIRELRTNSFKREALTVTGVIVVWLTTLSILILKQG